MREQMEGAGASLGGVAVLATCACGTSAGLSKLSAAYGLPMGNSIVHPAIISVGVALLLAGLWRRHRAATAVALGGVALLALGNLIVRPTMMDAAHRPYTALQVGGLFVYLAAAAWLVAAFYRAYPSRQPRFALMAMGGMVLAMGCTCCMVTGAMSGLAATFVPSQPWLASGAVLTGAAAVLLAAGLSRIGGLRAGAIALAGEAIIYGGPKLLTAAIAPVMVRGVVINFAFRYPVTLAGALVVLYGFVIAYRAEAHVSAGEPIGAPLLATE